MNDLRYAFRMLLKSPGFSLIAILTLALGIGANSAIFSVIETVLLRPLPFPQPNELAMLWSAPENGAGRETQSFPDYEDFRAHEKSFQTLTCYVGASTVLNTNGDPIELEGLAATSEIFSVLKVSPMLGRAFNHADDNSAARVVIFTYEAWQRYFNGDRNILGRQVRLALTPYTVIGIMPRGFQFPIGARSEYLTPIQPLVASALKSRGSHFLRVLGRLQPGVSIGAARAEAMAIAGRLAQQYPDTNTDRSANVVSLHQDLTGEVRPALFILLAAVVFVLLIGCANVANLLLARATARQREIAIRTALGASRVRLVRQLLAEGLLVALSGAGGGLFLAGWSVDLLRSFGPQDVPRLDEVQINAVVVIFTFLVAVASTLLFALVPALQVTRPDVNAALQEGNRAGAGPESHRLRGLLVVTQVALSLLLLAGAGLLIKSFAHLSATDPGFDPTRVLTADFVLPRGKYPEPEQQRQFYERFLPQLAALPGVEAMGGASPLPFSDSDSANSFWIAGRPDPGPGNHPDAANITVAGEYFRTLQIPLLAGRLFGERDSKDAPPVAIVNQALAQKFFPNTNPLGQHLLLDQEAGPVSVEIVGVVGNTHHSSLAVAPQPTYYLPQTQDPNRVMPLVFRTSAASLSGLQASIRRIIQGMDRDVFVPELVPMEQMIGGSLAQPRFNTMLLASFASVALVLAAIGIYGVIAYSVAQRTREIGIRMALGAQRGDVLRMILRQSMLIIGIGLTIGLIGAFALTRWMGSLLYGVSAYDLSIHGLVLIVLGGAGLIASYIPARRAMRVDPMVALRYE
ncbi:MAG TPA: ABC transporter permease [Chthoniobacterales bacterium]|jgi:putative ABC transport system permease protein|nr:ABC transporter permease [Chthoniobacterales bacterium]